MQTLMHRLACKFAWIVRELKIGKHTPVLKYSSAA